MNINGNQVQHYPLRTTQKLTSLQPGGYPITQAPKPVRYIIHENNHLTTETIATFFI